MPDRSVGEPQIDAHSHGHVSLALFFFGRNVGVLTSILGNPSIDRSAALLVTDWSGIRTAA